MNIEKIMIFLKERGLTFEEALNVEIEINGIIPDHLFLENKKTDDTTTRILILENKND